MNSGHSSSRAKKMLLLTQYKEPIKEHNEDNMTIHQTNYTGIENTKNITPFNNDGQDNSCNEQNMTFVQEWISSIQSFEEGFNAVNPIYFDDNIDPFTQPIIIVPAENNTDLELQENINDIFNLNSNEDEIKNYQILEPASVLFSSYIDKPNIIESNNVIELDHDVESNNNKDSSYHPSSHSSQSSEYAIPISVSTNIKIKSVKSPKKKENALSLLKNVYFDQTSSDSCSTQLSVNNEPKKLTRKRKQNVNRATWKRAIKKKKRMSGSQYVNRSNKVIKKKMPKQVNCEKCKFQCAFNFTEEMRIEICRNYWDLGDSTRQKCYLTSNIVENSIKRHRPRTDDPSKQKTKSKCFEYYLTDLNGIKHRVCQKFFCLTLHITFPVIKLAMKNCNEAGMFVGVDGRLGRTPPNKTSDKIIQEVKNHIQSFPKMESHYCRHDTKKLYLSSDLNISIMYRLYCSTSPAEPVSKIVYTRVFHEFDPALSFYKPKKDQCTKCNNYNNCVASNLITDKIKTDWSEHKRREKESLDMKKEDKNIAIDNKGKHFRSVSFDLQAVLNLPHAGDSQIYYKRKLSVFNFTIYEHHSANGYCYVWDELNGGKGSTEIGTCLLQYLENLPETVEHVVTYSDTCGGQNRNKYTMTAIMYAVQTIDHLQIIDIKYMESGHSYLEADSMHACIERAKKHKTIYTTREWSLLIQMARIKPQSYIVNVNTYKDFYDFQSMASGTNWNRNIEGMSDKMKWLKIKWIRFEKSKPFMVQFKYNLSDEKFMELNVMPNTPKKTPKNTSAIVLKKILKYKGQIPVSDAKKSDLLSLLKSGVIPKEYDSFYNSIPTTKNKKNTIPWSETDSDEETT